MQTALIALEIVGQLSQVSIDTRSIIKEFALDDNEVEIKQLTRILSKIGFKSSLKKLPISKLVDNYPLPAIVEKTDGTYCTIIKASKEKCH